MITSAHDTPDLQLAKRRGYLVSRSKQPRERWYGYCQAPRLPFVLVQGQKYASITCDLFPAKRVFQAQACPVVEEAWHAAQRGFRGGWMSMCLDRLDVYRLPMAGIERFLDTLTEVIRRQTDMEPCLKEHVRGIVRHCREAGSPLQLLTDDQGRFRVSSSAKWSNTAARSRCFSRPHRRSLNVEPRRLDRPCHRARAKAELQ